MDANCGDLLSASKTSFAFASGTELNGAKENIHLTNMSSLPVELLAMIFCQTMSPEGDFSFKRRFEPFHTTLRSVCRLWLQVVDSTPELWTRVVLESPVKNFDRLRAILQQSKNAPLDLTIQIQSMCEPLVSVLLPEIARARTLVLLCAPWELPKPAEVNEADWEEEGEVLSYLMQQFIMVPAPLLENLAINFSEIPADAFSHAMASRLRHLILANCYSVSPASCIFKSAELTTLNIDVCEIWESLDELIVLLDRSPKLQHLTLDSSDYPLPFNSPDDFAHRSVRLPDLKHICLHLPVHTLAHLLSTLNFPGTTELEITCFHSDAPTFTSSMDTLKSAFDSHFKNLFPGESEGYTDMHFGQFTRARPDAPLFVKMYHSENSLAKPLPKLILCIRWDDQHREVSAEIVARIFDWHGMAINVRKLKIHFLPDGFMDEADEWAPLLERFRNVSLLEIRDAHAAAVLRALGAHAVSPSLLMPALETVYVRNINATIVSILVETLDKRAEARLPDLDLTLSYRSIEPSALKCLKQQLERQIGVERVQWRRIEQRL